jgi:general secretion pathway protein G
VRQRLLEARRQESGFTLIELLIVIVILGVLAGVVVFAVGAFNDRGEKAACKADVKAVEVGVEAYRANRGTYPANVGVLQTDGYLRATPNTDPALAPTGPGAGSYYITYNSSTGAVGGMLRKGVDGPTGDVAC